MQSTLESERTRLVVSPYVLAELDYLIAARVGVTAELSALSEMSSGSWDLAQFDVADLRLAQSIIERYRDQRIGLTDASLVVLAERYGTDRILTLDRRHFSILRTAAGAPFRLLPE